MKRPKPKKKSTDLEERRPGVRSMLKENAIRLSPIRCRDGKGLIETFWNTMSAFTNGLNA